MSTTIDDNVYANDRKRTPKKSLRDDNLRVTYLVNEAARVAGSGERAIRDGIKEGRIPHIRLGRNILIPKAAFHTWLNSCGARPEAR